MKPFKLLAFVLILTSLMLSSFGQQSTRKVGGLEFGIGINTFGPASRMSKLMVEHGFNDVVRDWVLFENDEFPHYGPMGLNIQVAYSRHLNPAHSVRVLLNYSRLREVSGVFSH